jgi:hypothetical protein
LEEVGKAQHVVAGKKAQGGGKETFVTRIGGSCGRPIRFGRADGDLASRWRMNGGTELPSSRIRRCYIVLRTAKKSSGTDFKKVPELTFFI